ncbi:MAG: energy transducer TonB [Rivularia sp. (in: cyanobacteria)]
MSYVSVLKNIPELLSQPAGIAAIASVGIHGAIAFILPLMPVDSKPKQKASPASVPIVELSQAEQSRLPQKQSPLISGLPQVNLQPTLPLPKFATQPTPLAKLPPNLDSTKVILPSLPKSSANPYISSLPKTQSLPVLPQPNFNSSFNAKAQSGSPYRRFNQKIELGRTAPLASRNRSAESRRSTPSRLPNIPPIQSAPLPPELTRIPAPPPVQTMTNPAMGTNNRLAVNPSVNNTVPVNQPRRANPKDFVASTERNVPQPGDKLTLAGQSVQQWGQQAALRRKIELPNQPQPAQNTKIAPPNTGKLVLAKQLEEVRGRYPNSEIKQPISEVIKTKPGKEGKVEGTLVIDSDGKADYLKFVDRSVPSSLKKETRNYFRKYFKKNPIRKNGRSKVYTFSLNFKPNTVKTVEFSKPEQKLVDRLRSSKDGQTPANQKPSKKKPENVSRSSAPVKINAQPSSDAVVVPSATSAPVKLKPQIQIRTNKPAPTSANNEKPAAEVLLNNQEVPKVPSKPKPQARVNIKEPATQATSKPSIVTRLRNGKEDSVSEENSKKSPGYNKKLIQQLRKIKQERESSN